MITIDYNDDAINEIIVDTTNKSLSNFLKYDVRLINDSKNSRQTTTLKKKNDAHSTNDSNETSREKNEKTSKNEKSNREKNETINKKYDEIDEISRKKSTRIIFRFFFLASIDDKMRLEKKKTTKRIFRIFLFFFLIDEDKIIIIMFVKIINQNDMKFSIIIFVQSSFVSEFSIRIFYFK